MEYPLQVNCPCPFCGTVSHVRVQLKDYNAWTHDDVLAQDAFPYLTSSERELLITGICDDCFPSDD